MNKMTSKQYLIDVTLKTLQVNTQSRSASKVMCEIHYGDGDSYLKIKMQPVLKNGVASFYQERIRIPYSTDVALVFKIFKARKEIFLGHHTVEIQKMLQEKKFILRAREKLEEADSWIDFEVKIIDKQLFCDDQSDSLEDEALLPPNKSNYSEDFKSIAKVSDHKAKSELNTPFLIMKKQLCVRSPMLPDQFDKLLLSVDYLLQKHRMMAQKQKIMDFMVKNGQKSIMNSSIQQLKRLLQKKRRDCELNSKLILISVGILGLLLGFMMK